MHICVGVTKWLPRYVQQTIDLNLSFEKVIEKLMDSACRKLKTKSPQPTIEFGTRWGAVITRPPANNKKTMNAPPVNINQYADFDLPSNLEALVSTIRPFVKSKKHFGTQMLYVLATVSDGAHSEAPARSLTVQEAFDCEV